MRAVNTEFAMGFLGLHRTKLMISHRFREAHRLFFRVFVLKPICGPPWICGRKNRITQSDEAE